MNQKTEACERIQIDGRHNEPTGRWRDVANVGGWSYFSDPEWTNHPAAFTVFARSEFISLARPDSL